MTDQPECKHFVVEIQDKHFERGFSADIPTDRLTINCGDRTVTVQAEDGEKVGRVGNWIVFTMDGKKVWLNT